MTKRQQIIVLVGIVITIAIAVLISFIFSNLNKKKIQPKPAPIIRKLDVAIVKYSNVNTLIYGSGRVLSQYSVDVISEVQGKLLQGEILLKKGASFKKGQLLAKIYNTDAVFKMKSRKSSFLNVLANILPDLKIDYADDYQKWLSFFNEVDIDNNLPTLPTINTNQEKIFLASKGVLRDYYSIKSDEERLKKYYIYAPFSGAIKELILEIGSVVNPGTRIAKIIRTGTLEVEVPLKIADAKWINKGQATILKSENGSKVGTGIVTRRANFVDSKNQSINIYVAVKTGSNILFAGQYLRAEFQNMVLKNVMEIPRNATFNGNMVFVVDSGYLVKQEIQILKTNEKTVVFKGIEEGAEIVVQPLANANASMAVQTQFSNVHKNKTDSLKTKETYP